MMIKPLTSEEIIMEFYENRAKRPFVVFVWLWQALKRSYRLHRTRRVLQAMSDEQLKDMGLSRNDF